MAIIVVVLTGLTAALVLLQVGKQKTPNEQEAQKPTAEVNSENTKNAYKIFLVGDSMTHALGPYGGQFNQYIHEAYPDKGFIIANYSQANQNVTTLDTRLYEKIDVWDTSFEPILQEDPDLIIIESFGYNPLSELGIEAGLAKHEEVLDRVLSTLEKELPQTKIFFLATIAPDEDTYAQKILNTDDPDASRKAAQEREAYIEKHIEYAKEHSIPLINAYELSKTNGDGNTKYINPDDQIHPSPDGIELISREITRVLVESGVIE